MFYHVSDTSVATTYLLSYWVLIIPNINLATIEPFNDPFTSSGSFTPNYIATGDKLCYGSVNQGIVIFYLI